MSMPIRTQLLQFLNPIAKKPLQQLHRQYCRLKGKIYFSSTSIPLMNAKVWVETPTGSKLPVAYSQEDGAFVMDILVGRGPSSLKVNYFGEVFSFDNIGDSLGSVFHPGFMKVNDLALVLDVEKNSHPLIRTIKEHN